MHVALATTIRDTPTLAGWGRLPLPGRELLGENLERLTREVPLTRGLGRSYGDSSLPVGGATVACTVLGDRILGFDPATGRLRAEAGLSLLAINQIFLPRRWFLPVTPGTQFVTLGGAVASDVHGKNHHQEGCFGAHVTSLRLRVADGRIVDCGPELEPDLFRATVGGMGLTGHILEVEFTMKRIPTSWIFEESERVPDIETYVRRLKEAGPDWPYTVGWIDCISRGSALGRGILMKGRWATPEEARRPFRVSKGSIRFPVELPSWALGRFTVGLFNTLYYWKHLARVRRHVVHPQSFFYPLDAIREWNLLYGRRGFTQYQCVLPEAGGPAAARRFLDVLTRSGGASFLCVIKDCGPEGQGLLSFPLPGISIAVDLPVRRDTQSLVDRLNEFVIEQGGRIYLTKDAFTRPEHFAAMEPRLGEFQRVRQQWDPEGRLRSAQSVRVLGDRP